MYYYKAILENGEERKFSSLSFIKYIPEKDWFVICKESEAEYVVIDEKYYRVPWLKGGAAKNKNDYPLINVSYITEEEYAEYQKEQIEKQKSTVIEK